VQAFAVLKKADDSLWLALLRLISGVEKVRLLRLGFYSVSPGEGIQVTEFGIFNDESASHTENEAVEAGFYSREEAEKAIIERYCVDDALYVHEVEEPEEEPDEDEEVEDDDNET
jgi:hypothetical protein